MIDLRPDLVFVVSGEVWRDFCIMREAWGSPLAYGLSEECIFYVRNAIKAGDPNKAAHWKAVRDLCREYGVSWISAVEVDGELIQEELEANHSAIFFPPIAERKRVIIDGRG